MASNDLLYEFFGSDSEEETSTVEVPEDVFDKMIREGPKSGMVFETVERLRDAYQSYAKAQGFCVIWRSLSSTSKYTVISCDRAGKSDCKKYTKKINCTAHINAIRQVSGEWMVSSVHSTHNHDLDPRMSAFMAGHKRLSLRARKRLPYKEYKEIQEIVRDFQRCVALAYGSIEKMNFVKERYGEMKNVLMNWPPAPKHLWLVLRVLQLDPRQPVLDPKANQYANVVERN